MAEMNANNKARGMTIRHRGRGAQVWIYLGKMLRMFVYQNDWKVLPMAAIIAGLVGMVIRSRLFMTMEGTLMGGFALVMVCIWNGCFNSIQVICRERDVIKREHRSGMHISSYIVSHMIYQALLCLLQTGVTLYVTRAVGVKYPPQGLFTPWLIVDFGISMFLITFASDMMSLWVSCLAKTTTAAMTIMPFVLIFQLVFSGGMLSLPEWTNIITPFTISNPALKVLAAQGDYNARPVNTVWNTVYGMRDREIRRDITVEDVLKLLRNDSIEPIAKLREVNLGDYLDPKLLLSQDGLSALPGGMELPRLNMTVGELIDAVAQDPDMQAHLSDSYTFNTTVGGVIEIIDQISDVTVEDILKNKIAEASYNPAYENTRSNILKYWLRLCLFVLAFAALSTITLEFIDKDRR